MLGNWRRRDLGEEHESGRDQANDHAMQKYGKRME